MGSGQEGVCRHSVGTQRGGGLAQLRREGGWGNAGRQLARTVQLDGRQYAACQQDRAAHAAHNAAHHGGRLAAGLLRQVSRGGWWHVNYGMGGWAGTDEPPVKLGALVTLPCTLTSTSVPSSAGTGLSEGKGLAACTSGLYWTTSTW